jgi:hypothetical protein
MASISVSSYLKWTALAHFLRTRPEKLVMLHLPDYSDWGLEVATDLVARVASKVPKSAEHALEVALLQEENSQGITFTRKLRKAWSTRSTKIALGAVSQGHLSQAAARDVLASLLVADRTAAKSLVLSQVHLPISDEPSARRIAVASAQALIATGSDAEFAHVWPLIQSDGALGLEVLGADSPHSESHPLPLVARLREDQVADLYLWLEANRPRTPLFAFGYVGANERLEELERRCLDRLRTSGSPEAVEAVEHIRAARPDRAWLRTVQDDAERALRTNPGERPTAVDVLRMAEDNAKRYLSSEESLLQAVLTSLETLQDELVGDDPLVRFLWGIKPLRPRDEIDLSIFVAKHLKRDLANRGIVLNREVNISRINRTDIRVEAIATDTSQRTLVVTIEVKGSWNPQLLTAMETQLRDQYLARGAGKAGLYLVGWFRTEGVETRGPKLDLDDARSTFDEQARHLSSDQFMIKTLVLDCRWREELPKAPKAVTKSAPGARVPRPQKPQPRGRK